MKRICFALIFCFFSINSYAFWIWSPKTNEWKNPGYSPAATPTLQYEAALKKFKANQYKKSYGEFRKILAHYPEAKEAAESQYYLGRCLEELKKPYAAFSQYKKVIDSYPNSKRINEIVQRINDIGDFYLNRKRKKMLGVSVYDFVEHPAIEIFSYLIDKMPYSEYAPDAQYRLGMLFFQMNRYDEAGEAFQKIIDNYPNSEWFAPSKYQLAQATAKGSYGEDYDSTSINDATARLDEFISSHPDAQIAPQAAEQLKELRNQEAKKNFDVGRFYEIQKKYEAAKMYYEIVANSYSDSEYVQRAQKGIKRVNARQ
ncbi:MAG: outer membrane protein assembly factor BamD [Candidatus Omnitrophica bacterium]|nr:outer membrane protein assembly factor BamD [Candidatus Omnitrophota bacterium]